MDSATNFGMPFKCFVRGSFGPSGFVYWCIAIAAAFNKSLVPSAMDCHHSGIECTLTTFAEVSQLPLAGRAIAV